METQSLEEKTEQGQRIIRCGFCEKELYDLNKAYKREFFNSPYYYCNKNHFDMSTED